MYDELSKYWIPKLVKCFSWSKLKWIYICSAIYSLPKKAILFLCLCICVPWRNKNWTWKFLRPSNHLKIFLLTWSVGRRPKSKGGFVITYLLAVSVTFVTILSLNLWWEQYYHEHLNLEPYTPPVQPNTKHSIIPKGCHKQVLILPSLTKHSKRSITEWDLTNPAPVSIGQSLRRTVASSQAGALG